MPNASWTIALSISTWESAQGATSIRHVNRKAMNDVASVLAAQSGPARVRLAVQNITAVDRDNGNECTIEYRFDGQADGTEKRRIGDATYLRAFVDRVRARAPGDRVLLWLITHSAVTTVARTIPGVLGAPPKTLLVESVVTSPVDRGRPPGRVLDVDVGGNADRRLGRGARRRSPSSLALGDRVDDDLKLTSVELSEALRDAALDVLFLQSCQTGGLETLDALAEHEAAVFYLGSAANMPIPASEHIEWSQRLVATPTMGASALCQHIASAIARRASAASDASALLDAYPFAADLTQLAPLEQSLRVLVTELKNWVALAPTHGEALNLWLDDGVNRPEALLARVRLDRLVAYAKGLPAAVSAAAQAVAAAHAAAIPVMEGGSWDPNSRDPMSASLPNRAPREATPSIYERVRWHELLRDLHRLITD